MTDKKATYKFTVKDFTPETMPFGRLVEYYAEIARMLGQADSMHLIDIHESSHASQFHFDENCEHSVVARLMKINDGTAPRSALFARDKINQMLCDDATSGEFTDTDGRNVIQFPGNNVKIAKLVRMRDAATFTGELYHIAGSATDAKIRIKTALYGVVYCIATKEMAKSLREFLFEQIKVSGHGLWAKTDDGRWSIDDFTITDFTPIKNESLQEAVVRIRGLDIEWPDNVLQDIQSMGEKLSRE